MGDPYMRVIRKCRLGRSELAAHSYLLNEGLSKMCTHCKMQTSESLSHFLLHCPTYTKQRSKLFTLVNSILKELGLERKCVKSLLGINDGMRSKKHCQRTKNKVFETLAVYPHL